MANSVTINAGTHEQVALSIWLVVRDEAGIRGEGDERVDAELALFRKCLLIARGVAPKTT